MEKRDILLQLIKYYADGNKAEFARILGVPAVNVSAWITRNNFDEVFISTKCRDINPAFLVTGEGPMLKDNAPEIVKKQESSEDHKKIINELLAIIHTQNIQLERATQRFDDASKNFDRALTVIEKLINKKSPTTSYMVAEEINEEEK